MTKLRQKLIVATIAFSMVFTLGVGAVSANSAEEDIAAIIAIAESLGIDPNILLQGLGVSTQPNTTPTPVQSFVGVPSGFTFTQDMRQGVSGTAVRYLQIILNNNADTRVATSGAGSPGQETSFFGPATHAAVVRFQNRYASEVLAPHGLTTGTGYVGSTTRAKLNSLLSGSTPTTPTTPGSDLSAVLTQLQALADALKAIQTRIDAIEGGSGNMQEGDLKVTLRSDVRNVEITKNQTKDVARFRLEATDSDITVQRVDISFSGTATEFRGDINKMILKSGSTVVGEREISRSTVERDDTYIRFSGLDIEISKGGYKDLTIAITSADKDTFTNTTYTVGPTRNDAIRGVDGANLTVYAKSEVGRVFTLDHDSTGKLELKDNKSPEKGIVLININNSTEVDLLNFTLTAKESPLDLEKIRVDFTGDDTDSTFTFNTSHRLSEVFQDALLYSGDSLIDVQSLTVITTGDGAYKTGYVEFDIDLDLAKDASKSFTVVVDVFAIDPTKSIEKERVGIKLKADILHTDNKNNNVAYAYEADSSVNLKDSLIGKNQSIFPTIPTFKLTNSNIERSEDRRRADAFIEFDITAVDGDITITEIVLADYSAGDLDIYWNAAAEIEGTDHDLENDEYLIKKGEKVNVDITATIAFDGPTGTYPYSQWVRLEVSEIKFKDESGKEFSWKASDYEFIQNLRSARVSISGSVVLGG